MKISLNNKDINTMFLKCLVKKGEISDEILELDTFWGKYRFNFQLVKGFEKEIIFLLKQFPESFFNSSGNFLEDAILNKEGKRWGERTSAIQLFILGMIIDKVDISLNEKIPKFIIKNV